MLYSICEMYCSGAVEVHHAFCSLLLHWVAICVHVEADVFSDLSCCLQHFIIRKQCMQPWEESLWNRHLKHLPSCTRVCHWIIVNTDGAYSQCKLCLNHQTCQHSKVWLYIFDLASYSRTRHIRLPCEYMSMAEVLEWHVLPHSLLVWGSGS